MPYSVTIPAGNIQIYSELEYGYWPPHNIAAWTHVGMLITDPSGMVKVSPTGVTVGAYNMSFGNIY
jgi:uncharacterized protein YycO